jgi:hypothetical protein
LIVVAVVALVLAVVAVANTIRLSVETRAALRELDAQANRIDASAARVCVALHRRLHDVEAALVAHARHDAFVEAAVIGAALGTKH